MAGKKAKAVKAAEAEITAAEVREAEVLFGFRAVLESLPEAEREAGRMVPSVMVRCMRAVRARLR